MARTAIALHVIEKVSDTENLRPAVGRPGLWETGYWVIGDSTSKSLIGGNVYVHRGQKVPSHSGGRIVDIYHEAGADTKRRVVVFKPLSVAIGVVTDLIGWGNERKVVWEGGVAGKIKIADEDEESAFPEGALNYAVHRHLERDPELARRAKRARLSATGKLACEVCDFDFAEVYGETGEGFIEAHHRIPVSKLDGKTKTKIKDLALVCANCHRMLHRGKQLRSPEELRQLRDGEA